MKTFWIVIAMALGLLLTAHAAHSWQYGRLCVPCLILQPHCHMGAANERSATTTLKTFCAAQADFRSDDRDGDKICQFWRADVAGLYGLLPKGGTRAIKLIELSAALADDRPITDMSLYGIRSTKSDYWFRAIRHVDEDPRAPDPDRFAFCAFPNSPAGGKFIFIVDETNVIYRTEAMGRRGIEVFPTQEELRTQWAKLDY